MLCLVRGSDEKTNDLPEPNSSRRTPLHLHCFLGLPNVHVRFLEVPLQHAIGLFPVNRKREKERAHVCMGVHAHVFMCVQAEARGFSPFSVFEIGSLTEPWS